MDWVKIKEAYEVVEKGLAKRLDLDGGVVVYRAGSVIRIDFKNPKELG